MHILISNLNPNWGGGELWCLNAAVELTKRGHSVRTVVRDGSQLEGRVKTAGLEVVPADTDPFIGRQTDIVLCNNRKKDVRHLMRFKTRPRRGLILRKGVPRPIHDYCWGRREIHALCHIITNSDATSAIVRDSLPWFPPERITRIYNPVRFEPLPPVPGNGTLRIGAVSRLSKIKGVDVLLAAVEKLDRPWSLTIAGDGECRDELEKSAGERVTFLGHVEDVRSVYANSDVVVVPSRYEGFCYAAVEAALSGVPVVATRVGSLPEVVPHATFVPSEDPEAMAAALEKLEPHPQPPLDEMKDRFSYDRIFGELERTLEQAAGEDPVRR